MFSNNLVSMIYISAFLPNWVDPQTRLRKKWQAKKIFTVLLTLLFAIALQVNIEVQSIFSVWNLCVTAACCSFSRCYANLSFQLLLIVGFCSLNVEKRSMLRIQGRSSMREGCEKITNSVYVPAQLSMRQYGSPLLLLAFMLECVYIWFSPSELPHPSHNFIKV